MPGSKEVIGLGFWSADSRNVVFPGLQWFLTVLLPEGPPEESSDPLVQAGEALGATREP